MPDPAAPRRRGALAPRPPPPRTGRAAAGRRGAAGRRCGAPDPAHPGPHPGGVCLYAPELGAVFTGDTLFPGGPGATGQPFSDFPTIIASIRDRLAPLPGETVVHPGHGETTTVAEAAEHLDAWAARGF
ncbi:MBL fold metallo-hydrolase [Nocardiopsis sp. ARC36]